MIRFFDVLFFACAVICLLPLFIFVTFVSGLQEKEKFSFFRNVLFKGNKFKVLNLQLC